MAANKRPRKQYRPRPVNPSAIVDAFAAHLPMATDKQQDVSLVAHQSLTALTSGKGTEFDSDALAVAMNLSMLLTEIGVGREYQAVAIAGQEAVARCKARAERSGKWGLDGPGIAAIEHALELHDQQVEIATQAQMSAALREMRRRAANPEYVIESRKRGERLMPSPVLRSAKAERARAVRQIEIVDALISSAGEQFTLAQLVARFGSTTDKLSKIANRATESALIRKGRDVAGEIVYWAPTLSEKEVERNRHRGDIRGYEAYLYSHWRRAEGAPFARYA